MVADAASPGEVGVAETADVEGTREEDGVGGAVTRSNPARGVLQAVRRRVRIRSRLRWLKERWRQMFPRQLAAWTGPAAGAPTAGWMTRSADGIQITAESTGWLRSRLADGDLSGDAQTLTLVITSWEPPRPDWSGRLGPIAGLVRHEMDLPRGGPGQATVRVTLREAAPAHTIIAAALAVLEPSHTLPAPVTPDVTAQQATPPWLRLDADILDSVRAAPKEGNIRPYDVVIGRSTDAAKRRHGIALETSRYGVRSASGGDLIMVDAAGASPQGRQRFGPDLPIGGLRLLATDDGVWWEISREPEGSDILVAGRVGDPLDDRQRAVLTALGAVVIGGRENHGAGNHDTAVGDTPTITPASQAAALAQLAMTGLVVHAPSLPDDMADLLASELVTLVRKPLPAPDADPLDWELRSIAQRREAIRRHATAFALPRAVAGVFPSVERPPTVTAVLVTRRPAHVAATVAAMAAQSYPELDIVVGLHGCDLPAGAREWLAGHDRPVQTVVIPGDLSFGEALGEATRWARGSLLTKVDDDDLYGPEHIWDLVLARHYSGATVVGKGAEFVYVEPRDRTVRRRMGSELYSGVVAGGTMLLSGGDLDAVGGWRPLPRSVDRGLLDRVLNAGGLVYRTHGFGFIYTRHGDGHTWDPGVDYFMHDPRRVWTGLPPYDEFGAR